jgi:uncharacterized protein (DUF2249 family)
MSTPSEARKTRTLDLRAIIAAGDEPFTRIMAAVSAVGEGDTLVLVTPFLPSPLIEKLQSEGFSARPERRNDGSWRTSFRRE